MPTATTTVRITVLDVETAVWCPWCLVSSACAVTYAVETGDLTPTALRRLRYCEGCVNEDHRP